MRVWIVVLEIRSLWRRETIEGNQRSDKCEILVSLSESTGRMGTVAANWRTQIFLYYMTLILLLYFTLYTIIMAVYASSIGGQWFVFTE